MQETAAKHEGNVFFSLYLRCFGVCGLASLRFVSGEAPGTQYAYCGPEQAGNDGIDLRTSGTQL